MGIRRAVPPDSLNPTSDEAKPSPLLTQRQIIEDQINDLRERIEWASDRGQGCYELGQALNERLARLNVLNAILGEQPTYG